MARLRRHPPAADSLHATPSPGTMRHGPQHREEETRARRPGRPRPTGLPLQNQRQPPQWDLCAALGCAKGDDAPAITKYRKLALKYHPDRNRGDGQAEAAEKFRAVSDAASSASEWGASTTCTVPPPAILP